MNAYTSIIEAGLVRGRLSAVQLYLREVNKAMNVKAHYIPCPDCEGTRGHERYCECAGLGCDECGGKGIIFTLCRTCEGDGEVVVTEDEGLEVYR